MTLSEELAKKYAKGICSECRGNAFAIKQAIDEAIERCALEAEHALYADLRHPAFLLAARIRALKSK